MGNGTLVNLTDGGEGVSGAKFPNRKMAEDQRLSMIGRKFSQETKDKISKTHKGKKQFKEVIEKRTLAIVNSPKFKARYKKVVQKSIEGEFIKIWDSASLAKKSGFSHVTSCCVGNRKTSGGYAWEYYQP